MKTQQQVDSAGGMSRAIAAEPTLATITVTFNPSLSQLEAQLYVLPEPSIKVIVDNASHPQLRAEVAILVRRFRNVHLICSETNRGLAAAINLGAQWLFALERKPELVLLLDQDSEPQHGSIEALMTAFLQLSTSGGAVGAVGPLLQDPVTGLTHGFHQSTRLRWTRAYPSAYSSTPVSCSNLNGSGTLMSLALFRDLGGLDEDLFIDHVDTEWAFRILAHGYKLWGIPNAVFKHSMGEASTRIWLFGWRVWPVRSPIRHQYLYRNAVKLMNRPYVPRVWKVWAIAKLTLTAGVITIGGPLRVQQLSNMWRGVVAGLKSRID